MSATGVPVQQVDRDVLESTWGPRRPGIVGWLGQCNHKAVGLRFIVTAMAFFLIAGAMALLMRTQLAAAENDLVSPEVYNQLFTLHGTLMMFFFAVPILEGLAIYFLPLQLGARDMPMPRLGAFGYWVYLAGGILLLSSLLFRAAPDGGWYAYPPLTSAAFSPGLNIDVWLLGVTLPEVSAIVAAVEIIVLIFRSRAPGMTLARLPLFGWSMLATSAMILVAFPPLVVTSLLLEIERKLGTPFFDGTAGGDPLLWQHLFWWFGHPEVYIQLLPALGILATVIPVATRRRLPMRWLVVASFLAIAIVSFGLWVHHMFTTGIPALALQFFSSASFMIAIPSGVIVLSFIAAFWTGRANFDPPTLYAIGFLVIFVFGGITGVMVGTVAFNFQAHDTYFVVGHFHSVLLGGNVFPVFAGLYHWFPKVTGRHVSRRAGQVSFWLMLIGFMLTFVPQHVVGFLGMVRRMWTYEEGLGWEAWNLASSLGSGILGVGVGVSVVAFALAWRRGAPAAADPWGAPTLEWSTDSPVPQQNFSVIPVVASAEPRWGPLNRPDPVEATDWFAELGNPPEGQRETPVTTAVHGQPAATALLPTHSLWPLWATVAIMVVLVGVLFDLWWLAGLGVVLTVAALVSWTWIPGQADLREPDVRASEPSPLDGPARGRSVRTFRVVTDGGRGIGVTDGGRSIGWWGTVNGVIALGHLAAAIAVATVYLRSRTVTWPPTATEPPGVAAMVVGAGLALVAGGLASLAERGTRSGRASGAATAGLLVLAGAFALAGGLVHLLAIVLGDLPVGEHAFWSIWWLIGATSFVLLASAAVVASVTAWHVGVRGVIRTGHHAELAPVRLWLWSCAVSVAALLVVAMGSAVWWG